MNSLKRESFSSAMKMMSSYTPYIVRIHSEYGGQASTYQMALLLQFNTATEHTIAHLQACTQLKEVHSIYM